MHAHIRTRGILFAASFRRWQAFGSGPHVGLMLTHSPDPHKERKQRRLFYADI